jgi:hypothetical protein
VGPASAGGPGGTTILAAVDGGITPSITLAGQGLVVPPSLDDVDFMCSLLLGCSDVPLQLSVVDHGDCVRWVSKSLSEPAAIKWSITMRECGLQSNSCSELRTCATRGAASNACDGRGIGKAVGFCDGDGRALQCKDSKLTQVRDCPRVGEQCAAREGTSTCTLGSCPSEVPSDGTPVCSKNGQKVFSCDKGKLVSFDCTAFGLTCITDNGKPACASEKTTACTNTDKCDGDNYVGCVSGHEVKVQCDKAGMKCASSQGSSSVGSCDASALAGAACDPSTFKSQCVGGNSVEYCVGGHKRTYFCKGSGFSKCTGGSGSAHCSN